MASFNANTEPVIGNVPPVNPTPMLVPIPEDKLKPNTVYLIETNRRASNGSNITRKYRGALEKLRDGEEYYIFKYLENIRATRQETIHASVFNGEDDEVFIKIYDSPNNNKILTVEDLTSMEEANSVVEGNTYYIRFVGEDQETDLDWLSAFRGRYDGLQETAWGSLSDHAFSNIVKLNTKISVIHGTTVTFYYPAEHLITYDRQRRAIGEIIPYGQAIIDDPSATYGGNKRKTNRRKSNKGKRNKDKSNKRKSNTRKMKR